MKGKLIPVLATLLLGVVGVGTYVGQESLAAAQGKSARPRFSYAVKFICAIGAIDQPSFTTDINVHNPQNGTVTFAKKAVNFVGEPIGPSPKQQQSLESDFGLQIDCDEIAELLGVPPFPPTVLEGFVVIETPKELDVVAVYGVGDRGGLTDFEVVYISPQKIN